MTRSRPLIALFLATSVFGGARAFADNGVTVNYEALKNLPSKQSAGHVRAPKLVPPALIGHARTAPAPRASVSANAPAGAGEAPPAAFEVHETLYNAADTAGEETLDAIFARALASRPPVEANPPAEAADTPVEVANAESEPEPVFVSWNRAETIGEVLFHANGVELGDIDRRSIPELDKLALRIGTNQTRVLLRAFGGSAGDDSHEAHRLALRRGLSVRKYLMLRGVPSICIDVNAMGGATDGGPADRVDVMAGSS
jgi:outer membrane protein OmpA-like peptidoglycan-associated protein